MILVGALLGAGIVVLLLVVRPPGTSALVQLGRFDALHATDLHADGDRTRVSAPGDLTSRLGMTVAAELQRRGYRFTALRQDLALTGRSFEAVVGRKLLGFLSGVLLVLGTSAGVSIGAGVNLPPASPLLAAVIAGGAFFMIPDLETRREAFRRRRDFRIALSAYLDLVALEMAGSAAPAEALPNAAAVGTGWPLALLRDTLLRATLAGRDQWQALSQLGDRIGVSELRDLGTLVQLVGRDGARVRQTLTARAATMRSRELADTEGEAGQRDQSMLMAQVLIGFGFIVFLGYPAVVALMSI